jgi:hypothetical protein
MLPHVLAAQKRVPSTTSRFQRAGMHAPLALTNTSYPFFHTASKISKEKAIKPD